MTDIRTKVAGSIFLLIAILHLLRFFMKWEIVLAGNAVPVGFSGIAAAVFALLAFWMLKSCCKHHE